MAQIETPDSISKLKELFKRHSLNESSLNWLDGVASYTRRASVLIPLFFKEGELHVILTKRSSDLTYHAGYIAFPGGKKDDTDKDDIETALRESEEEIGLKASDVEVIAVLSPSFVRSPFTIITPVIGIISPDFVPVKNDREVAFMFDLPLKRFLSAERRQIRDFKMDFMKQKLFHIYHFLDSVNGEEVDTWGFTAAHCVLVAVIAFQSDKQFCFVDGVIVTKDNTHKGVYDLKSVVSLWKIKPSL